MSEEKKGRYTEAQAKAAKKYLKEALNNPSEKNLIYPE